METIAISSIVKMILSNFSENLRRTKSYHSIIKYQSINSPQWTFFYWIISQDESVWIFFQKNRDFVLLYVGDSFFPYLEDGESDRIKLFNKIGYHLTGSCCLLFLKYETNFQSVLQTIIATKFRKVRFDDVSCSSKRPFWCVCLETPIFFITLYYTYSYLLLCIYGKTICVGVYTATVYFRVSYHRLFFLLITDNNSLNNTCLHTRYGWNYNFFVVPVAWRPNERPWNGDRRQRIIYHASTYLLLY